MDGNRATFSRTRNSFGAWCNPFLKHGNTISLKSIKPTILFEVNNDYGTDLYNIDYGLNNIAFVKSYSLDAIGDLIWQSKKEAVTARNGTFKKFSLKDWEYIDEFKDTDMDGFAVYNGYLYVYKYESWRGIVRFKVYNLRTFEKNSEFTIGEPVYSQYDFVVNFVINSKFGVRVIYCRWAPYDAWRRWGGLWVVTPSGATNVIPDDPDNIYKQFFANPPNTRATILGDHLVFFLMGHDGGYSVNLAGGTTGEVYFYHNGEAAKPDVFLPLGNGNYMYLDDLYYATTSFGGEMIKLSGDTYYSYYDEVHVYGYVGIDSKVIVGAPTTSELYLLKPYNITALLQDELSAKSFSSISGSNYYYNMPRDRTFLFKRSDDNKLYFCCLDSQLNYKEIELPPEISAPSQFVGILRR